MLVFQITYRQVKELADAPLIYISPLLQHKHHITREDNSSVSGQNVVRAGSRLFAQLLIRLVHFEEYLNAPMFIISLDDLFFRQCHQDEIHARVCESGVAMPVSSTTSRKRDVSGGTLVLHAVCYYCCAGTTSVTAPCSCCCLDVEDSGLVVAEQRVVDDEDVPAGFVCQWCDSLLDNGRAQGQCELALMDGAGIPETVECAPIERDELRRILFPLVERPPLEHRLGRYGKGGHDC